MLDRGEMPARFVVVTAGRDHVDADLAYGWGHSLAKPSSSSLLAKWWFPWRGCASMPAYNRPANEEPARMKTNPSIFKAYDIRGVVGQTIDETFAEHLGRAFGSEAVAAGEKAIAVGRDGRLSGPALVAALVRGLASTGLDVVAINRAAGQHHLEAVVVLRVVAARDLDARAATMLGARSGHVVEHRRGHGADVDDIQPGRGQPAHQGRDKRWA